MEYYNGQISLQMPIDMGKEKTFDKVFREYYAPLCAFAKRYLQDSDEAEEAVSHLFENLWKKKSRFENFTHLRSFLYRSVYNVSLNLIRSHHRKTEREQLYSTEIGQVEDSFLGNFFRTEVIADIYREIQNLPETYSSILLKSYRDGLKNVEIAQELGLSVQTVKNYKNKAMALLKRRLPKSAWIILYIIHLRS